MSNDDTLGSLIRAREEMGSRENANISANRGMYEAVLVASFGGVHYSIAKGKRIMVHPFFLLACCLPVFSVQLTALFALRMSQDVSGNLYRVDGEFDVMLLQVKLLMVAVVALINFQRMLNSVYLFFLVMNPHFWIEIYNHRAAFAKKGMRHRAELCWMLSISACFMSAFVNYVVCVDSLSVVLAADSAQDAIFDCLALTFLQDLDEYWWQFFVKVWHLSPLEDFKFEFDHPSRVYTEEGELTPEKRSMFMFPCVVEQIINWTPCLGLKNPAAEIPTIVILFMVYVRQLFILLLAVDTGVLPSARIICDQYSLSNTTAVDSVLYALDMFLLIDINAKATELATGALHGCPSGKYHRVSMNDQMRLANRYPTTVGGGLILFAAMLLVPKLMRVVCGDSIPDFETVPFDEEQEQGQDMAHLQKRQDFSDLRLQRLEENMGTMLWQRTQDSGGVPMRTLRGWR